MIQKLYEQAKAIRKNAYAKYSNFLVGACLRTSTGEIFCGVNVENVSFPCGQCAEASAIGAMVSQLGPEARIESLVVVGEVPEGILPCGNCLQRISEFSTGTTKIVSANLEGIQRSFTLDDLLPQRFKYERFRK